MNKKNEQLGMLYSTARHRLMKDILFKFITDANIKCHRCGKEMSKDNLSIEHIKPWLDSENPTEMFFDLDNISFSHVSCNSSAGRRPNKHEKIIHGTHTGYNRFKCRCELCVKYNREAKRKWRASKK